MELLPLYEVLNLKLLVVFSDSLNNSIIKYSG